MESEMDKDAAAKFVEEESRINSLLEMTEPEELTPELKEYVYHSPELGWEVLKHPLIFAVPYTSQINAFYNKAYHFRKKKTEEDRAKGDWKGFVFLHEKPHWIDAFLEIVNNVSDEEYWEILGGILVATENMWEFQRYLPKLLSGRPNPLRMMDEDEKEFYDTLPDEIKIFRGYQNNFDWCNKHGYSWTLSFWHANWFSERYHREVGEVSWAICKKEHILSVFLGRNEAEILVDPQNLRINKVQGLSKKNKENRLDPYLCDRLEFSLCDRAEKVFKLGKRSHHGPWHWRKVAMNTKELCKHVQGSDPVVCIMFAYLHDCQRINEMDDPKHGYRAAGFIRRQKRMLQDNYGISEKQLDILAEACKHHNEGGTSSDPTIGVCWDADRLDLIRVGQIPDRRYFSTEAAKTLLWKV